MNNRASKWAAGALAATIVASGLGFAAPYANAASPFKDVVVGHWAEKHITKLALQGILKGSTTGQFNPNNAVSRQEAIIIAIRFMGIEDEVKKTDVIVLPSALVVKDDYKPYIQLALQKGLLNRDEEIALATKEKGKEWGKSAATREWFTRLLVRSIGKDAEAKAAASQATSFVDDSSIDALLKGYVNVGVAAGLINGVSSVNAAGATVTKFDPAAALTRATASTLFSRAEAKLAVAYSGQVTGTLMSASPDKLTLLFQNGTSKDFAINASTPLYRYDTDKPSSVSALKLYGEVTVITAADDSVGYVEQTNDTPKVVTHEGTLTRVSPTLNRITLLEGEDSVYYFYDPANKPTVADAAGQAIALDALPANVPVKVVVDAFRAPADRKILSITVKQSVANKTGTGTVVSWDAVSRALQVKDDASTTTESYTLSANATIKKDGINVAPEDLKAGDTITYDVKTGSIASVVIVKSQFATKSGLFSSLDKTTKTIQYTIAGKLNAEYLTDNAVVKIDGYADATLDDLNKDDAVTLTFNDAGKVSIIAVTGRSVQPLNGASISSYVADAKTLIVYDAAGKKYNLDVTATTRFDLNGTKLTVDQALPYLSSKGKKINVGISGTNAVYVSIIAKYAGTVTENNATAKTLKLTLDNGSSITISYGAPIVDIYGVSGETIADVKAGDIVTVLLNGMQDQASSVLVQKNAQFEYVSADATTGKLRAKKADGTVEEWTIGSGATLQDENGAATTLAGLNSANLLNVTFSGSAPIKVKAVTVAYGRVASVNTAGATIDLALPSGATVTKSVGATPLVLKNNVVQSSLAAVSPDDRVEIRKDENDRVVIQIVTALRKQFWYYESSSRTLNVLHELTDPDYAFTLHPQAYIHLGTTVLTMADIKREDAISLYLLRGKIVEVAK
ncbi:S-layer homology domain-containing protein [Cohnella suwonensis]|uniref:S-layer homology domain-containing protein n=1 Tax=Cohnella suwonensis TaxID=696072 RepID=A0ABW0LSX9_9BACL